MRAIGTSIFLLVLTFPASSLGFSQSSAVALSPPIAGQNADAVPRVVKFSGKLDSGQAAVRVTFAIYSEQASESPIWQETQELTPDDRGNYTTYLGSTHPGGLPADLFASGEARWLGILPEGQAEQARVLLVQVYGWISTGRHRGLKPARKLLKKRT